MKTGVWVSRKIHRVLTCSTSAGVLQEVIVLNNYSTKAKKILANIYRAVLRCGHQKKKARAQT